MRLNTVFFIEKWNPNLGDMYLVFQRGNNANNELSWIQRSGNTEKIFTNSQEHQAKVSRFAVVITSVIKKIKSGVAFSLKKYFD